MSNEERPLFLHLRRRDTGIPWGFRMQGGNEYGEVLYIQKVNNKSIAQKSGLRLGDAILVIGQHSTKGMNHEQAKMEIIRAGNELDMMVQRDGVRLDSDKTDGRSIVSEERTEYKGYTNPSSQSRSFKILQQSLSFSEADDEEGEAAQQNVTRHVETSSSYTHETSSYRNENTVYQVSSNTGVPLTNENTSLDIPPSFWDQLSPLPLDFSC